VLGRTSTSTLLQRVEAHIDRLDRALKETEDLLHSLQRRDRDEWIRRLYERLTGTAPNPETRTDDAAPEQSKPPFYRS
jgi:hypothetical protein